MLAKHVVCPYLTVGLWHRKNCWFLMRLLAYFFCEFIIAVIYYPYDHCTTFEHSAYLCFAVCFMAVTSHPVFKASVLLQIN